MSKVLKQSKAVLITALMYNDINIYNLALEKLINNFGEIEVISDEYLFSHSIYYKEEMGDTLNKRFIVFKNMIERDYISNVKRITDNIEREYLDDKNNRKINIDPAILTLENFILVTNKNFTHRIYLKDGVFADLTLIYKKKEGYTELPWTYADYSSDETKKFLKKIRELFYNRLIESSPFGSNWK
ncbi:DUF4416 family protein [Brachyspira murdochii]|uniref:Conserved hypothetical GTP-binding protein n=1 Tax=Brachyspira murdochii (strain ATCC 51284 / DSM 12563 / 56-150) TaxID=526224 RepID=D5U5D4_BRAM5|nr:DUF4416 family protein [Brachyspira murdochii]ADG70401.1 conserved hypothetical GTP-binding protein [Brachyspira murdochii DSM 12563]